MPMSRRKIPKRKGGPTYTDKLCSATKLLEVHEVELVQAELGTLQLQCKEMVLVDLVKHQQVLAAVLQQNPLEQKVTAGAVDQPMRSTCCARDVADDSNIISASSNEINTAHGRCQPPNSSCPLSKVHIHTAPNHRPFAHLKGDSVVVQLFRSATFAMVQKAALMTKEDWMAYFKQLFPKLAVLLQILSHATEDDWSQAAQFEQDMHLLNNSTQTSAAAHQQQKAPAAQHSIADGCISAAPFHEPYQLSSAYPDSYIPGACLAQDIIVLDKLVHEMELLMLLAGTINPVPVYSACTVNLATGEPMIAKPAVRRQVASRLRLTDQQAQQLAVSLAEFQRGSRMANSDCAGLVREAADCGILLALLARQIQGDQAERTPLQATTCAAEAAASAGEAVASCDQQQVTRQADVNKLCGVVDGDTDISGTEQALEAAEEGQQRNLQDLDSKLRSNMLSRQLQHMSQNMLVVNTLTTLQVAAQVVASYPMGPLTTTVVEAVQIHKQGAGAGADGLLRLTKGLYWEYVQEKHDQQRLALLQQQQRCWWQELADLQK